MTATLRTTRSRPVAALALALALAPAPAAAQYMYLDSNGDGVHAGDDRVNGSGPTAIDIWLDTDTNRDGTPAVCDFGLGVMNLNSYEFVLQAVGGTMTWGPITNNITSFTFQLVRDGRDTTGTVYYHNGWGASAALPPGLYKLASMTATVATGSPRIDIVTRHNINRTSRTTFGTECVANPERDHMNRFGVNWGDADGLASPVDAAPRVTAPGMMLPTDGSTVQFDVSAADPDGDAILSLAADVSGLPAGHGATFSVNGSFTAGTFTWTPAASDSGNYNVKFTATNFLAGSRTTVVHVVGTPTAVGTEAASAAARLEQNRPNPFGPGTEIRYALPRSGEARLLVFEPGGRLVRVLSRGPVTAGPHVVSWDGRDEGGRRMASGVYWLRLEAEGVRLTRRMVLTR